MSLSFEATRALRTDLDVLAQSVEPLKGLQDRIIEILDSIRAQLADLAMSLEAAKALRMQLSAPVQNSRRWDRARPLREDRSPEWSFSPHGSTSEVEDYRVDLDSVSVLELALKPDLTPGNAFATLAKWRVI